ncbi:MAG TPA: M48 family metalloprotease [Myxococcaceae bacterium]|nr:M48 family metalloprotease [Myxococcaceae bacterium]
MAGGHNDNEPAQDRSAPGHPLGDPGGRWRGARPERPRHQRRAGAGDERGRLLLQRPDRPGDAPGAGDLAWGVARAPSHGGGALGRAGIPKPRLYLIPEAQPNAFATGRNPEHAVVAVTSGLLELLDRRELRGVLAHELAHVKNRDILVSSIAATVAAAVTYVAHVVGFFGGASSDEDGPSPLQALALAIVAPLAATLIQLGISRSREYGADRTGAEISGDPDALARALEKLEQAAHAVPVPMQPATASLFIVNPFSATEGVLNLFSTHPSMRERVRRLRAMQDQAGGWPVGARDATLDPQW